MNRRNCTPQTPPYQKKRCLRAVPHEPPQRAPLKSRCFSTLVLLATSSTAESRIMKKFKLTTDQTNALRCTHRLTKDKRAADRIKTVYLLSRGKNAREIAEI